MNAISPLDGRYASKTTELRNFFTERALMEYRIRVEVAYLKDFCEFVGVGLDQKSKGTIYDMLNPEFKLDSEQFGKIKLLEHKMSHDVKAVECWLRDKFPPHIGRLVHFGLTSHDVNNVALKMQLRNFRDTYLIQRLTVLLDDLRKKNQKWLGLHMLARTHGQYASPTTLGKEFGVFAERLEAQISKLKSLEFKCKFGGATGNFNAHVIAFPQKDFVKFANKFCQQTIRIERNQLTTQVDHWDGVAEFFQIIARVNCVLVDLCRDVWFYISYGYFGYRMAEGDTNHVGSSTMPHKVNPIHFENAEGNLLLGNALCVFLAQQLPLSRMQRDLVNSTLYRNFGVAIGHSWIAYASMLKGLGFLEPRPDVLSRELNQHYEILAEAVQSYLKIHDTTINNPYQVVKTHFKRPGITHEEYLELIPKVTEDPNVREELSKLTPHTYIGILNKK